MCAHNNSCHEYEYKIGRILEVAHIYYKAVWAIWHLSIILTAIRPSCFGLGLTTLLRCQNMFAGFFPGPTIPLAWARIADSRKAGKTSEEAEPKPLIAELGEREGLRALPLLSHRRKSDALERLREGLGSISPLSALLGSLIFLSKQKRGMVRWSLCQMICQSLSSMRKGGP